MPPLHAFDAEPSASPSIPPAPSAAGETDETGVPPEAPVASADGRSGPSGHVRRGPSPFSLALALVAVLAGAALFLGGYSLGARVATTPGTPAAEEARFAPFWDVYDFIESRFAGVDRPTPDQLVQAAIKGMMQSLNDPWSYYQSPADFQSSLLDVGGQAEGIGVVVQLQPSLGAPSGTSCQKIGSDCELAVVQPIAGSPASAAGVKPGDVIAAVNGTSLDGLTIAQATTKIKGPQNTSVRLTLVRGSQTLDVTIVRKVFNTPQVTTKVLAGGQVEYVDVAGINPPAASQFQSALQEALAAGRRSFVIDLRGNGGGYVDDAISMASQFVGSGVLAYQVDASGKETPLDASPGGIATDPSIKVVVLVDKNTASAAEIFAGALQGRGRALLVGEPTYGKGVVQAWLPLPDDQGGVHLTVARWLTPEKVWIQGKGLQPNVAATSQGARAGTDPVLDAGLQALGYPVPSVSPQPSASPGPGATAAPSPSPRPSPSPAASSSTASPTRTPAPAGS